jgi:hypothetical protein
VLRIGPELRADCSRCAGLCCVAPAFAVSTDFAIDKPAGQACPNLRDDFRCGIHDRLRERGFAGCTVFDCLGAGQRVSQHTFAGRDWRTAPDLAGPMFETFGVVRQLHELLWYLVEALGLPAAATLHPELAAAAARVDRLAGSAVDRVAAVEPAAERERANPLLRKASELTRGEAGQRRPSRRGADPVGARLAGADLHAADLRGAVLVGTDLRDADLRLADLTGADLRGADLAGADLTGSLFVLQSQLDSARGDAGTRLPSGRSRPRHWTG